MFVYCKELEQTVVSVPEIAESKPVIYIIRETRFDSSWMLTE